MSKEYIINMSTNLNMHMTIENEELLAKWEKSEKKQKRVSFMKEEVLDFVNKCAFEDFGFEQSSFSKEVCKLILIARDCIEKNESSG